jgi:hypothetical protein
MGKNDPTKIEVPGKEISCFEMLNVLFGGLKASSIAWAPLMEA